MDCSPKCSVEGEKEIRVGNVVNMVAHELLDFAAVQPLQYTKAVNIKCLK